MSNKPQMVEHHTKYKEIHGVDKTVWMTRSDHRILHNRLRREGKCLVPVDELRTISNKAQQRTGKCRKYKSEYNKQTQGFEFNESVGSNVQLREQIRYNHATGSVNYIARFKGNNGFDIPVLGS